MEISKSSRHAKITGDFGEAVVLYWLSKYGFECALVDHTGIDIIAKHPRSQERMGISVKSRSRNKGKETDYLTIPNDQFLKAKAACEAFGCEPYFAIVVDAADTIHGFILSLDYFTELAPPRKSAAGWKMTQAHLDRYAEDPKIISFQFTTTTSRWWPTPKQQVCQVPQPRR